MNLPLNLFNAGYDSGYVIPILGIMFYVLIGALVLLILDGLLKLVTYCLAKS